MNMDKRIIKASVALTCSALLASCANTPLSIKNDVNKIQSTPKAPVVSTTVSLDLAKPSPPTVTVDWAKIEATADKMYEDEPLSPNIFFLLTDEESNAGSAADFYAKDFNVSIEEAQRRLILQGISGPLIDAVARELGDAVAGIYYDNNNPNEYSVNFITLNTVKADPAKFVYQFKHKDFQYFSLPIYIKPTSTATQAQIFALQEKATPEIFKRYPDTQTIGYSPLTNTINVGIYTETPDEAERKRIEAELTELVGHPVIVEFMSGRMQLL